MLLLKKLPLVLVFYSVLSCVSVLKSELFLMMPKDVIEEIKGKDVCYVAGTANCPSAAALGLGCDKEDCVHTTPGGGTENWTCPPNTTGIEQNNSTFTKAQQTNDPGMSNEVPLSHIDCYKDVSCSGCTEQILAIVAFDSNGDSSLSGGMAIDIVCEGSQKIGTHEDREQSEPGGKNCPDEGP